MDLIEVLLQKGDSIMMIENGRIKKWVFTLYIVVLALCAGAILALGIFVAPVIFVPDPILGKGVLSHFQSGLLMSKIFVHFNYLLGFTAFFVLFYEFKAFFSLDKDKLSFFAAILVIYCAGLFILYYTPFILQAQSAAQTQTSAFLNMHKGSELDFKILLFSILILIFRRVYKRC